MSKEPVKKTPENIAAAGGAKFLDSKIDEIPDANRIADFCDIGPGDDSLAVVMACIPIAEAAAWVVECRRRAAEKERNGTLEPLREVTLAECTQRMKDLAKAREKAGRP